MTTACAANLLPPTGPVGHFFELCGWVVGVGELDEIDVLIDGVAANVVSDQCPGAPPGSVGFRARATRWFPSGMRRVVVVGPDEVVLTDCPVLVGSRPGEPPLWLGRIDSPKAERPVTGQVVMVSGWALLDSRVPSLVEAQIDGVGTVRARTRLPRPDVVESVPGFDDAAISGFEARIQVDLPPGTERTLSVRIRCRTEGVGERFSPEQTFVLRNPPTDPRDIRLAEELAGDTARALTRVPARTDPRHLLVFTHSLSVGGAELWLQDLLTRLVADHGWRVSLVSETDGPLRDDCAALGVPVHVTTHYRVSSVPDYEGHVGELARFARCSGARVALVNTLGGFAAADAAKRAGLPTAWAIHESFTLPEFAHHNWGAGNPPPAVWSRWHSALAEVDRLLFVADATRELFLPYTKPERCLTIRYGTPMWTFGGHTSPELRRRARAVLGFARDDLVVLTVGIAQSRKGHGPLISALERILAHQPRARLSIVGLRTCPYSRALVDMVHRAGLTSMVHLVPVQRDPTPWLRAADVFVNCSDIESLPRSILEAVCCGVPVAATDVFGAREMITDGRTGWLFEPNDVDALAAALHRALNTSPATRRELAAAAYQRLAGWLDPAGYAREYSQILAELGEAR